MTAVGRVLAGIMAVFLLAAAMSSGINIPAVQVSDVTQDPVG